MITRPRVFLLLPAAALAVLAEPAAAALHALHGHDVTPDGPWYAQWNLRLVVLLALAALGGLYLYGVRRLWLRAGRGRGISRRQAWIFMAGVSMLFLALASPIDLIAEQLNAVHMVQHMLLIKVAAPLLVLGSTGQAVLWAMPRPLRHAVASIAGTLRGIGIRRYVLWQPLATWACFALVLWLLHIPELYQAALRNRFLHDLQHIAFVVSACLFWRVLLDPISSLRLSPGLGVLYLFSTMLHASALGVFMAFSPGLWYSDYAATTAAWNIQPLVDQQVAGYIMWMPACVIYAVAAAFIFGYWLREPAADAISTAPDLPAAASHDP